MKLGRGKGGGGGGPIDPLPGKTTLKRPSLIKVNTKKINETRNYLLDEIKHNELISEKHIKVCMALFYFEHFLAFASVVSGYISISASASLISVTVGIASYALGLKVFEITAGIKNYKSIIKKKRKKHKKIVLLEKIKLSNIKV